MPGAREYKCSWCGFAGEGTDLTCSACGAAIDVTAIITDSGWQELPGIRDMAKIQFGNSHCQIEGLYVPVADMNLAPQDWVYFAHHLLLWKEPQVNVTAMSLKGAWKRMLAGLPIIMTAAQGPGHIAFSRDEPGELIALPIHQGQAVDVREHVFMVATGQVAYDWFQSGIWYTTGSGDDRETHYPLGMYMDRFTAPQAPGLLLLHAAGNCFVRTLGPGEVILVKPTALLFKDPHVQMQLHIEQPAPVKMSWWSAWNQRYLWLRLFGPGRVAVQSAYTHME
ncbi:MAG: AIM24 family protein, partial [Blastocatellia bacterium]